MLSFSSVVRAEEAPDSRWHLLGAWYKEEGRVATRVSSPSPTLRPLVPAFFPFKILSRWAHHWTTAFLQVLDCRNKLTMKTFFSASFALSLVALGVRAADSAPPTVIVPRSGDAWQSGTEQTVQWYVSTLYARGGGPHQLRTQEYRWDTTL